MVYRLSDKFILINIASAICYPLNWPAFVRWGCITYPHKQLDICALLLKEWGGQGPLRAVEPLMMMMMIIENEITATTIVIYNQTEL